VWLSARSNEVNRAELLAKVVETFPDLPHAQVDRLLSAELRDDERQIILQSWADAKKIPGPDGWAVFMQILRACADVANLVIPIEGAVQGIVSIGRGG
jgi:hypothetical protein